MTLPVRLAAFAVVAAVALGVGYVTLQPRTATDEPETLTAGGCHGAAVMERYYGFSDWVLLANQAKYRVDWRPASLTCDLAKGTADVMIQITHRETQRDINAIDTGPSIITQDTGFTRERISHRFDCKTKQIAALERQLMGDGDVVLRTISLLQNGEPAFKPYGEGGVGVALDGPVCATAMQMGGS